MPSAGGAIHRRRVMIGLHVHSPMNRLLDFRTCRGYRDDGKHAPLRCFAVSYVGASGPFGVQRRELNAQEEGFGGHSERPAWHDVAVMGYRHSIGLRFAFVGDGACSSSRPYNNLFIRRAHLFAFILGDITTPSSDEHNAQRAKPASGLRSSTITIPTAHEQTGARR